jgi:pseudouridylate synthase
MPVTNDSLLVLSEEVATAIAARRPMVALETTVITHGLPPPSGVDTARVLEDDVRRAGATPVTIGILDGAIRLGLTRVELERLATAPHVSKVNPGNLAAVLASRQPGSTTVAVTMFAAHAGGIRVFATGGIGGVHRGAEASGDISADLDALATHPVITVSAGAKAFLDLARTLEYLETRGVPVLGWRHDWFPAFYTRSSGLPIPHRVDDAETVAAVFAARSRASSGALVAVPIPVEAELDAEAIDAALATALADAEASGISGAAVTPFVLERIAAATAGRSIPANLTLAEHNAGVAGEIAVALSRLDRDGR